MRTCLDSLCRAVSVTQGRRRQAISSRRFWLRIQVTKAAAAMVAAGTDDRGRALQRASFVGTVQPGQWIPTPEELAHVYDVVTAWTATKTRAELADSARRHQFLAGPQNTVLDILESEQLASRSFFVPVEHPELGETLTYLGAPFKMSATPWQTGPRPPLVGEHTDEILGELGIDDVERAELRDQGVL